MTPYDFLPQAGTAVRFDRLPGVLDTGSAQPVWAPTDTHTRAILDDTALSDADKRAALADWASDRRAMANLPSLRQLDDGTILHIDDILHALKSLDRSPIVGGSNCTEKLPEHSPRPSSQRPSMKGWFTSSFKGRRSDDDDDPPPCPAGGIRPFGPSPMHDAVGIMLAA